MHTSHDFIATKTCPSCEFLVFFGKLRVYDRKNAGRVRVGSVQGGSGQDFSNSCGCGQEQTKNFNPRRTPVAIRRVVAPASHLRSATRNVSFLQSDSGVSDM